MSLMALKHTITNYKVENLLDLNEYKEAIFGFECPEKLISIANISNFFVKSITRRYTGSKDEFLSEECESHYKEIVDSEDCTYVVYPKCMVCYYFTENYCAEISFFYETSITNSELEKISCKGLKQYHEKLTSVIERADKPLDWFE